MNGQNKLTCDWLAWLSWDPEKGGSEICVHVDRDPEKGLFASVKKTYRHVGVHTPGCVVHGDNDSINNL